MLKITIAQLDSIIGDFDHNVNKIKSYYERACQKQARLILTPELSLCGYIPQDALDRPEFFEKTNQALSQLKEITKGQKCALVVGYVLKNLQLPDSKSQNVISVIEDGKIVFTQAKTLLAYYDIFDEPRYFEPAQDIQIWKCEGYSLAFAICEDLWSHVDSSINNENSTLNKKGIRHQKDPVEEYKRLNADLICSISASPYEWNKQNLRYELHQKIVLDLKIPLLYVNRIGSMDGVLFDGSSFILDSEGKVVTEFESFVEEELNVVVNKSLNTSSTSVAIENSSSQLIKNSSKTLEKDSEIEKLTQGLLLGIRNYFQLSGFKKAILGLSGGIDSAVVATLAARALGPGNVLGVAMPSQYSSSHSLEDAEELVKNLGILFYIKPIKFLYSVVSREIQSSPAELLPVAQENLQSRLRGLTLMTLSNQYSALVLATGNKSEFAMGYATLYGDMIGALCPIGDLYKTRVYELARHLNEKYGNAIPLRSITKPPSAELRANQTDQDTLPPYELLDQVLEEYLIHATPIKEIQSKFGQLLDESQMNLDQIIRQIHMNEYKRKQAPLILKTSSRVFGTGRRIVMGSKY